MNRAMAYRALKELDAAFREASRAVELAPSYQVAWEQRAGILFERDGFEGAERGYGDAIRQFPDSGRLYQFRGENRFKHYRLQDAIADFDRSLALSAETERAALLVLRGLAYRNLGDYAKAEHDSQEAVQLRPTWARAESNLGWAILFQGRVKEAHDHFTRAAQLDGRPTMLVQHALTSSLLGDDETAAVEYTKACEAPNFENACLWAWEIETRRSRRQAADRLLELTMKRVEAASVGRRAFIAALVENARAVPARRDATGQRALGLAAEESWTLEAEYILGCFAAARADANRATAWFEKCAAHSIPDWLDRSLAIARLRTGFATNSRNPIHGNVNSAN